MIVQTSPILGGGARCQSPLGPPGVVTASSDVSRPGQLSSPLDSPKVSGAGFVWAGAGAGGQPGQGVGSRYRSVTSQLIFFLMLT